MTIYQIESIGKNKKTGQLYSRKEYIDTRKNSMFKPTDTAKKIATRYERFWNADEQSAEKIKVVDVKSSKAKSRGENWGIKVNQLRKIMG